MTTQTFIVMNRMQDQNRGHHRLDSLRCPSLSLMAPPSFVTLGMFIIDDFEFLDESGQATGKEVAPQVSKTVLAIFYLLDRTTLDRGWRHICSYRSSYLVCLLRK